MKLKFTRHSRLVVFLIYVTALSCQLQFITPNGKLQDNLENTRRMSKGLIILHFIVLFHYLLGRTEEFLGVFAKLRKSTFSFVMSVCPSAWNNSTAIEWILMKFHIEVFFSRKSVDKIPVSLKTDKNNGYFI